MGNRNVSTAKRKAHRPYQWMYLGMILPGIIFIFIFNYLPMGGLVMAFQRFKPAKGIFRSEWVGLYNFQRLFLKNDIQQLLRNTLVISLGKIVIGNLTAIIFSILLNEINRRRLKKCIQTVTYLPHFLSWVVLGPIVYNMLGMDGALNVALKNMGLETVNLLGSNATFQGTIVGTHVWKEFGYTSIVYLAAITGVDPGLHEAAAIDGANWWKRPREHGAEPR